MPANLTPQYEKAEQRYKAATSDPERLEALQEMLSNIPKHKGTEKMQADLKRKISQLRKAEGKKGPSKGGVDHYHVPKSGAGQVVLVGLPNCGKTSLVVAASGASLKVADYPFTTTIPAPGMWPYEDVQIQLVDTPPVTVEEVPGGLMGTIRSADIVALVVDASTDPLEQLDAVLAHCQQRGLLLRTVPNGQLNLENPQERTGLIVASKVDAGRDNLQALRELYAGELEILPVSVATAEGLGDLARRLWELLDVIRVYTKEPGKPVDKDRPYTLPTGSTIEDLAHQIHRELPEKMKFARIWGDGRFEGQRVHRTETLRDKDIVEIHQ